MPKQINEQRDPVVTGSLQVWRFMDYAIIRQKAAAFAAVFSKLSPEAQQNYIDVQTLNFTHNTVAIEGNRATVLDAELLLKYQTVPQNIRLKDLLDIVAQHNAVDLLFKFHQEQMDVDQDVICAFHQALLYPAKYAGIYRTENAFVTNVKTSVTPGHLVYAEMRNFEQCIKEHAFADPIEKASFVHCRFVKIHPFSDGNGRTARLIMNLSLLNDGLPLVDIDVKNREAYMKAIQPYAEQGDLEPFRQFLAETLMAQMDRFLEQAESNHLPIDAAALKGVYFMAAADAEIRAHFDAVMHTVEGARFVAQLQAWAVPNTINPLTLPEVDLAQIRIYRNFNDLMLNKELKFAETAGSEQVKPNRHF